MKGLTEELKQEIIQYIEKNPPVIYWDYQDELQSEQIETLMKPDGQSALEDEIWELCIENICEIEDVFINKVIEEFEDRIIEEIGEERGVWEDDFEEWAKGYFCVDLNLKQLYKNTGKDVFFYDTGEQFDDDTRTPADYRMDKRRIKRLLGIKDSRYDKDIDMMLCQASYGGSLVVYFREDMETIINVPNDALHYIVFEDAHIAIIDIVGGSGDDCYIKGHKFSLPFNRENMFYERSIKYNYSFAVCGMGNDWCESTEISFAESETERKDTEPTGVIGRLDARDKEYARIYKEGGCTNGDIDFQRHRDVYYKNEYPCGNHCPHCGMFWID